MLTEGVSGGADHEGGGSSGGADGSSGDGPAGGLDLAAVQEQQQSLELLR
jgi:hypothetical protein